MVTDPQGHPNHLEWNRRGQLVARTDCSGKRSRFAYDEAGELTAETDPLGHTLRYDWDGLGRLQSLTHADGQREQFAWDALGLLVGHADTAGNRQTWRRDARGRVEAHTDAEGRSLEARYNTRQQLDQLSRGDSRYHFHHDPVGRLLAEQRPDGVEIRFGYDSDGNLESRTEIGSGPERPQRHRHFRYDRSGRLLGQGHAQAETAYAWTPTGQLQSATRIPTVAGIEAGLAPHTIEFRYDALGRLTAQGGDAGELAWAWDSLSNLQQLTLPQGQVLGYQRYGSGHVHGITFDGEDLAHFERDDLHREIFRSQGAITATRGYDARGRLIGQTIGPGEAPLLPGGVDPSSPSPPGHRYLHKSGSGRK